MIRRFSKHEPNRQLDLFAPRPKANPRIEALGRFEGKGSPALDFDAPCEIPDDRKLRLSPTGWYVLGEPLEGPVSRYTGGCLNAVEAWRTSCGYSLELAGLESESGVYCARCMRFLHHNPRSRPLYEAARGRAAVPGAEFDCSRCRAKFRAHRFERA